MNNIEIIPPVHMHGFTTGAVTVTDEVYATGRHGIGLRGGRRSLSMGCVKPANDDEEFYRLKAQRDRAADAAPYTVSVNWGERMHEYYQLLGLAR